MENQKRASKAAVICYGFGDLASQFVWTFVGSYLTLFYTDVVGLAPAIVSIIMMGARIWDAVNDPMMGAIAERTRSRFGRFRPYIAFGCPFLALFGVLTFTNPFGGSSVAGIIWAAATYIIAGMLYTCLLYTSSGGCHPPQSVSFSCVHFLRKQCYKFYSKAEMLQKCPKVLFD